MQARRIDRELESIRHCILVHIEGDRIKCLAESRHEERGHLLKCLLGTRSYAKLPNQKEVVALDLDEWGQFFGRALGPDKALRNERLACAPNREQRDGLVGVTEQLYQGQRIPVGHVRKIPG